MEALKKENKWRPISLIGVNSLQLTGLHIAYNKNIISILASYVSL